MPTESKEITVEVLHIDVEMWCTLCSIDENGNTMSVCYANDILNGIDGSEDIANMGETNDSSLLIEKIIDSIEN